MCHIRRLDFDQQAIFCALPIAEQKRLVKVLEDSGIPSKARYVRPVFERFLEHKGLTVAQAEEIAAVA